MKKPYQIMLLTIFFFGTIGIILTLYFLQVIRFPSQPLDIGLWIGFVVVWLIMVNEGIFWVKNGKRSDWSDLVAIIFLFITVFLLTRDIFTSVIGAFSIYLLFGIAELKDYEVLNKILYIALITYNFIFLAGIFDKILQKEGRWTNTAFSISFWLMLGLGFLFFGRRYLIVFRFMSAQYLVLLLYVIAWLALVSIAKITSLDLQEIKNFIYVALILTDIVIYIFTGPILDLLMGYKKITDRKLIQIVESVAVQMNVNPKRIKIRFGKYPILNAMAYGALWDMHLAIIAPNPDFIPEDELRGIVAHEVAHLRGKHTLILTLISILQIIVFWLLKWPVTIYDYTFQPDQPFPLWVFIVLNFIISIFLYVIVRDLEAHADLATRRGGFGYQLAKGLYNLESFYAFSHEIGLDATLLSDEKITEENRLINYLSTAQYLDRMMVKPTKGALLSNLINSHPPSYHRIIASLNDREISPHKEAIMPLLFLFGTQSRKFHHLTQNARQIYLQLCTQKIKTEFKQTDIRPVLSRQKIRETLEFKRGKLFAYQNYETKEIILGNFVDIDYIDDASEPIRYRIEVLSPQGEKSVQNLNPTLYHEKELAPFEHYLFKRYGICQLIRIDLETSTKTFWSKAKGIVEFRNSSGKTFVKPIFTTNLSRTQEYIASMKNQVVYLKKKGSYLVYKLRDLQMSDHLVSAFVLESIDGDTAKDLTVQKGECTLLFENLLFPFHHDTPSRDSERSFLQYLWTTRQLATFLLKKAVNSEIIGVLDENFKSIDVNAVENAPSAVSEVKIHSIFDLIESIPLKKLDAILLRKPTIIFEKKSDTSIASKIIHIITSLFHPEQIWL